MSGKALLICGFYAGLAAAAMAQTAPHDAAQGATQGAINAATDEAAQGAAHAAADAATQGANQGAINAAANEAPWPCAQRRTPTISAAAVWAGPDIAKAGDWEQDSEAAALAEKLASRRTPLADIGGLLDDFVKKTGADKDQRLTRVFVGALASINSERDRVLSGIAHFAEGQQRLAEKVRTESEEVADDQEKGQKKGQENGQENGQEKGNPGAKALAQAKMEFAWDRRIFAERSQSLAYVCETPGILEQRAFEIARRIQEKL